MTGEWAVPLVFRHQVVTLQDVQGGFEVRWRSFQGDFRVVKVTMESFNFGFGRISSLRQAFRQNFRLQMKGVNGKTHDSSANICVCIYFLCTLGRGRWYKRKVYPACSPMPGYRKPRFSEVLSYIFADSYISSLISRTLAICLQSIRSLPSTLAICWAINWVGRKTQCTSRFPLRLRRISHTGTTE